MIFSLKKTKKDDNFEETLTCFDESKKTLKTKRLQDRQMDKWVERLIDRWTDSRQERQKTEMWMNRKMGRQTGSQKDRLTGRQTDK